MKKMFNKLYYFILFLIIDCIYGEETYCEWGLCEPDEYCCGQNDCCTQSMDTWFFWSGVLLIFIALAVGCMIRGFCSRYREIKNYQKLVANCNQTYTQLPKNSDDDLVSNLYKSVPGSV